MKMGTKSVLFGVHQFLWHPFTVLLAWFDLYGMPKPWEVFCIFIHDIGYIGKTDMDGESGFLHPELGAKIAGFIFGEKARNECLGHSRSYAETKGIPVSRLCWADKWSPIFDPTHFYWLRGNASGEIHEYRANFPRAVGESSLMWAVSFKDYVRENSPKIWAGANGDPNHGYLQRSFIFTPPKTNDDNNTTHKGKITIKTKPSIKKRGGSFIETTHNTIEA
jgi:hypothetical protein